MLFKKPKKYSEENLYEVLQACTENVSAAQEYLYQSHYSFAKSISLRYCNNAEDAEEVLNDSFIKVFNNLSKFDMTKPFKAWLRTILVNTSIDYYRKSQRETPVISLEPYHEKPMDSNIIDELNAVELLKLVQELSPSYRTVLMMYAIDGYNHQEIAERLGISEGTSKSNLARARQNLVILIEKKRKYELVEQKRNTGI